MGGALHMREAGSSKTPITGSGKRDSMERMWFARLQRWPDLSRKVDKRPDAMQKTKMSGGIAARGFTCAPSVHTHTREFLMLQGCCARSFFPRAKPREPCPQRLTQSPASPANLCPLFPIQQTSCITVTLLLSRPHIHAVVHWAKTPHGCLQVPAAYLHPAQPIRSLVSRL